MAGLLEPRNPITVIFDDPAVTAAGGITPTKWNHGMKLTGGTDKQVIERSTAADGTSGINLTSTPTVSGLIFPLTTDPTSLPNGSFTIVEVAGVISIHIKKSDGTPIIVDIG